MAWVEQSPALWPHVQFSPHYLFEMLQLLHFNRSLSLEMPGVSWLSTSTAYTDSLTVTLELDH